MKTFSLLALIWTLYYLAKRITENLLTTADLVVCGCVLLFASAICWLPSIRNIGHPTPKGGLPWKIKPQARRASANALLFH